jgi:long-chain acyl-CoA synthetase
VARLAPAESERRELIRHGVLGHYPSKLAERRHICNQLSRGHRNDPMQLGYHHRAALILECRVDLADDSKCRRWRGWLWAFQSPARSLCELMPNNEYANALEIFEAAVSRSADGPAIRYFDGSLSYRQIDGVSDALAAHLAKAGVSHGDRVAIYLQNTPHFPIVALAAWKLGAIGVPVNPMNREREVSLILANCRPSALVCLDDLFESVISKVESALVPRIVICVTGGEFQSRFDPRVLESSRRKPSSRVTLLSELAPAPLAARSALSPTDVALLVYTSGTTGLPKGAMITHRAFSFNANAFPEVAQLREGAAVLAIAPLFHITGMVCCFGTAMMLAAPLILTYRFEPGVVLDAIREWQPKFVVAAITAFIALFNHDGVSREHLASLEKVYSGGAPVPGSFVERFEAKFGLYIHNCYGLTETAAPTHIVPFGSRAPTSRDGVLSIGREAPGARACIVDENGATSAVGAPGEMVIQGPMVSPGYWENPAETAAIMRRDGFRTGDIGIRDQDGWFYIVDRKKDVIISSGYKVWPREVEDVLYTHPSVREAAVVGAADPYRGEAVKAFVSLRPDAAVEEEELIDFCRARMAAYKYPRSIQILEDLPKTASGKILRRALR